MKKLLLLLFLLLLLPCAQAQEPASPPPATAAAAEAIQLAPTKEMMAGVAASQLAARINEIIELAKLLDTGIPAQGNNPGVTGKELQTALGQANCDKIRAAAKVLGGNRKAKIDNPK